jgi:hypothetical protein
MITLPSGIKKVEASDNATIANQNRNDDLIDAKIVAQNAHIGAGGAAHAVATQTTAGFESAADKTKLDGIATGAGTANSATDTVIGTRTINDAIAVGTTDIDTPTNLFSKIGAMIRAITGKADWWSLPVKSLEALNTEKAPLASPALTGVPTAPTAVTGTNTTQIASTAFALATAAGSVSLVTNGYQKLASGLIIQWGYTSVAEAGTVITLPISWPVGQLAGAAMMLDATVAPVAVSMHANSLTTMTLKHASTGNRNIYWMAFGM